MVVKQGMNNENMNRHANIELGKSLCSHSLTRNYRRLIFWGEEELASPLIESHHWLTSTKWSATIPFTPNSSFTNYSQSSYLS